jgi:TonB family protein
MTLKKLSVVTLLLGFLIIFSGTVVAQKKRPTAPKPTLSKPVLQTDPCKEENTGDPYSVMSGPGVGQGSGTGTGRSIGTGGGVGDGTGISMPSPPPPSGATRPCAPVASGPTTLLRIMSKPAALYTDRARENQVQGTVRLRVTFHWSGRISGVTAVSGLGYGLTEQAIAAAKQITFEPQKKNGAAVTTIKTVEYNFTIY